ncbi:acyl-CoA/acyl-ACP dehydrogenase [Streptacidiphilus sp. PB12-B1b]|uniref:acyl-CoA dehydrogenase family protein n=1 Tax=Streptacidiphilus sp. PB12-B1b TaxID=2705012 RepID=UPI0015FE14B1|nr:acyl-CoA dehydrogenase family protein [Streptacidiphilus sp. PB12-B1b]QMU79472.1 acyl-CoA/acyl-ACP dehydrogenase [Streptacidiphilus sp. PB12-B1b]
MDPAPTPEQEAVRRTLREALAKRCTPEQVRAAAASPSGHDPELWRRLAEQPGLPGLALPAEYGGAGLGPIELALACEETGRVLLPSPLLGSCVLAAGAVLALGTPEQRARLLPALASGERTAALVLPRPLPDGTAAGGGRAGGIQARPRPSQDRTPPDATPDRTPGWLLYGEAAPVVDGARADLLVVAAHTGGFPRSRTVLYLVAGDAPGLTRSRCASLDETRALGRVELRDTVGVPLGDPALDAGPGLDGVGLSAALATAAEAVGAAEHCLARAVEYAQTREQFGRPIGSFQAIKHKLADVYVAVESARSAVHYAAWSLDAATGAGADGGASASAAATAVLLALAQALECLHTAAAEAIQVHGGIAITWEHDIHLYFKRAVADELLFGAPHRLRARAAARAGLFPPGPHAGRGRAAAV